MLARLVPIALALAVLGCEKPSHENIEKWANTKKGPSKLKSALLDDHLDPDLSAHAAAVMIKTGRDPEVKTELDHMATTRRTQVVAKLAPRLWELARVEGDMLRPAPQQTQAKDALVLIRKYADDAAKTQIDGYLIDWYAVGSYEARATAGGILGAAVLRMIGPPAGKKMMSVASGIIAAPGQDTVKKRLGDQLLLGLAATGDPEAVRYLLDIAHMKERHDETLAGRALVALYRAYVDPEGLFDVREPAPLAPNLGELVKIAQDDAMPPEAANSALALIQAVGPPQCLAPLLAMIPHPHADPGWRYVGPAAALKCGGVKAIEDVVRAMPDLPYDQKSLAGSVVHTIAKLSPRDQVLVGLRDLLADKSKIARWVAIETLAEMKSTEDAPKIASVKGGGDRLVGYSGEGGGKKDPSLGERAKELAASLGK